MLTRALATYTGRSFEVLSIGMCDDEPAELERLGRLIGEYCQQKGLAFELHSFERGKELLSAMAKGQSLDILFLDVYMESLDGIHIARKVREIDRSCRIVFATNSQSHAIKGYAVNALHYLLKPITAEKMAEALDRAMETLQEKMDNSIQVQNRQRSFRISLKDIVFAESKARIIIIHLRAQGEVRYYDRLDNLERKCGDERFLRCHKSFLVNLDHVQSIVNNRIHMETGEDIPISISIHKAKELFAFHTAQKI